MAHPADYYIKYLMVLGHTGPKGRDHINKTLSFYRVPKATDDELQDLEVEFKIPQGLLLTNKKHEETRKFMQENDLLDVWDPDKEVVRMLELAYSPMVLQTLQILLVGRIPIDIVVDRVNQAYPILKNPVTARMVESYMFYFWNFLRVGDEEWLAMMYKHPFGDHILAAMKGSPEQALWRVGFNPKIDGRAAIKDMFRNVYFRAEATRMMRDTKETAEILTKYSKEMVSMFNTLMNDGNAADDAFERLKGSNITLETTAPEIKALTELIDGEGSHSGSGRKHKKDI